MPVPSALRLQGTLYALGFLFILLLRLSALVRPHGLAIAPHVEIQEKNWELDYPENQAHPKKVTIVAFDRPSHHWVLWKENEETGRSKGPLKMRQLCHSILIMQKEDRLCVALGQCKYTFEAC
jgi:hypothetical protein